MILGYMLLSLASLLLLFDIYSLPKHSFSKKSFWNKSAPFILSVLCVLATLLLYVISFLNNDFSLKDVYSYSSVDLPSIYKLYSSWAGVGGSLLLWSAMLSIVYLIYRILNRKNIESNESKAYIHLSISLIFLLAATLLADPFATLSFKPEGGLGLNPLLQSPWMAIHPPVIFLGYSLPFFPLAFSFANLSGGKKTNEGSMRFFMQFSWLFFTLGIALGGVWAYEVLGWGGYWSWDPVETASLLPWLMLTAYFHTAPMAAQGKSLIREFSIVSSAFLVIFATIITRSGALESVHAFEASVSGTSMPFILLLLYLAGYFIYLRGRVNKPIFQIPKTNSKDSASLTVAYIALIYITAICLIGVSLPVLRTLTGSASSSLGKEFYNTWLLPPTILFVITLILCNTPRKIKPQLCMIIVIIGFLGGAIGAILKVPTPNYMANLGIPLLLVALVFTVYGLLDGMVKLRRVRLFPTISRSLIHVSLVLILLGVFLSSSMEASEQRSMKVGEVFSGLGVTLKLTNVTISGPEGSVYTQNGTIPEHSSLELEVVASSGERNYSGKIWTGLYSIYGLASRPLIFREALNDIYITTGFTDSLYRALLLKLATNEQPELSEFTVQVKVIPYINLIWLGVIIFCFGIIIAIISGSRYKKNNSS